ncbi:hypothetical protein D3C76_795810 [compost metagenome]
MQAMQRHGQPIRTVLGFVEDFVGGLLETEQRQRRLLAVAMLPGMGHGRTGQTISLDKSMPGLVQVTPGDALTCLAGSLGKVDSGSTAQHHRCSIVEGTQHAADVLVRAVLGPALIEWPRRFTLEIDQVGIALNHQHLAQVQVTMHAHQQPTHRLLAEFGNVLEQALALLLQIVDQGLAVAVEAGTVFQQQVQGAGQLGTDLFVPGLAVAAGAGPRLERRVGAGRGQQQVHLAQALAEQGGEAVEFGQRVGMPFGLAAGRFHFVANGPFQGVLGPGPGVALVAQVALGDHQQVRRRVLIHAADPGQQGRDIAEPGRGEIGAHLQLRVNARVDPADQLEHHAVAHHHRTVGLLGAEVAHRAVFAQGHGRQLLGAVEAQLAQSLAARQPLLRLTGKQHSAHERFEDESVGDQPDLTPSPHPRQRQLLGQGSADLFFGQQPERQLVVGDDAIAEHLQFAEQHRCGGGSEAYAVVQAHLVDRPFLAGEPAPLGQVLRQDRRLQRLPGRGFKQLFHTLAQHQCGQFR